MVFVLSCPECLRLRALLLESQRRRARLLVEALELLNMALVLKLRLAGVSPQGPPQEEPPGSTPPSPSAPG